MDTPARNEAGPAEQTTENSPSESPPEAARRTSPKEHPAAHHRGTDSRTKGPRRPGLGAWDALLPKRPAVPDEPSQAGPRFLSADEDAFAERLLDSELVSEADLDHAEECQARTGSNLGEILLAESLVDRLDLHRALARHWGVEVVDVAHAELDTDLFTHLEPEDLAKWGWIPLTRLDEGTIAVATSERPTSDLKAEIEQVLGTAVELVATSSWDILSGLHRVYEDRVLDRATVGLWLHDKKRSARIVMYPWQKVVSWLATLVFAGFLIFDPVATLVAASATISVAFLAAVLFKFVVSMAGLNSDISQTHSDREDPHDIPDSELPRYTILVPMYREAEVVGDLVANLDALDYPREKLDVILLLEESDDETPAALASLELPPGFSVITVPDAAPKTKPKACNVGLAFARGEFLVIYDAEDRPDPDQLRKAVAAFRASDQNLVCVQAALNYWNVHENALTRMFTLEYSYWFDYMLHGLDRLKLPIPLGGTSNHFRTAALRRVGGWDPYNVTEDADLGIRMSAVGARVGVIDSTTFEEANRAYGNWIRQRSRWIKGYMQTTLVHLRDPVGLVQVTGFWKAVSFLLLVAGTPASFLVVPPLLAMFLVTLLVDPSLFSAYFPGWVLHISFFNLLIGNSLMIYLSMMGAFKRRRFSLVGWALLNPVYWLLHSAASYKALWQLLVKPHYWEKTQHGISKVTSPQS